MIGDILQISRPCLRRLNTRNRLTDKQAIALSAEIDSWRIGCKAPQSADAVTSVYERGLRIVCDGLVGRHSR